MKYVATILLLAAFGAGCSQSLPPAVSTPGAVLSAFFWTTTQLDSNLDYYIIRSSGNADHPIFSKDGVHVQDGSLNRMAFRLLPAGDTVAIDSIGSSSIFSLPAGYYFAGDSEKAQQGSLKLLLKSGLHAGGSWYAGTLAGFGLGQGVSITADVLDHVDTLLLPAIGTVSAASYGESYMIRYAHDSTNGAMDPSFPISWKVYYSRAMGPVLIEEYLDSSRTSSAQPRSLQSQAVLRNSR